MTLELNENIKSRVDIVFGKLVKDKIITENQKEAFCKLYDLIQSKSAEDVIKELNKKNNNDLISVYALLRSKGLLNSEIPSEKINDIRESIQGPLSDLFGGDYFWELNFEKVFSLNIDPDIGAVS